MGTDVMVISINIYYSSSSYGIIFDINIVAEGCHDEDGGNDDDIQNDNIWRHLMNHIFQWRIHPLPQILFRHHRRNQLLHHHNCYKTG